MEAASDVDETILADPAGAAETAAADLAEAARLLTDVAARLRALEG